jgi:excisionase family DNA binding protein
MMAMTGSRFMSLADVAREAGVSVSSVRHWVRLKKLRSARPGRRRVVARDDFERFMRGELTPDAERRPSP